MRRPAGARLARPRSHGRCPPRGRRSRCTRRRRCSGGGRGHRPARRHRAWRCRSGRPRGPRSTRARRLARRESTTGVTAEELSGPRAPGRTGDSRGRSPARRVSTLSGGVASGEHSPRVGSTGSARVGLHGPGSRHSLELGEGPEYQPWARTLPCSASPTGPWVLNSTAWCDGMNRAWSTSAEEATPQAWPSSDLKVYDRGMRHRDLLRRPFQPAVP